MIDWNAPGDWKIKKLSDVADVNGGYVFTTDYQGHKNKPIPFYKVGDMNGSTNYMSESRNYVDKDMLESMGVKTFDEGSVVFPKRGEAIYTNKVRMLTESAVIDNNMMCVSPCSEYISEEYLYYCMSRIDFGRFANKSTVASLRIREFRSLEVPVPQLDEQERIVEAVEERLERVERLEKSAESVGRLAKEYQDSYTTSLLAGMEDIDERVDIQDLSDSIPDDWQMKNFGDVIDSSLYGCNPETGENIDGVPYLRISDVREDGGLKYSELPEKAKFEKDSDIKKYELNDGDVVIARSGASCGQSYVYEDEHGKMVYALYLIRFSLNKDVVGKGYIRAYLSSPLYWEQVDSEKKGAAQNNINAGSIKNFKIPVPPVEQQRDIVNSLGEIDYSNIQCSTSELSDLCEEYRESVLASSFEGKINR